MSKSKKDRRGSKQSLLSCFSCFSSRNNPGSEESPHDEVDIKTESIPEKTTIDNPGDKGDHAQKEEDKKGSRPGGQEVKEDIRPKTVTETESTPVIQDYGNYNKREPLAEERKEILKANKSRLHRELPLTDRLIGKLWNEDVISTEKKDFIQLYYENRDRVNALISSISKGSNGDFDNMCDILSQNGQGKVVKELLLAPVKTTEKDDVLKQKNLGSSVPGGQIKTGVIEKGSAPAAKSGSTSATPGKQNTPNLLAIKKPNKTATRSSDHFLSKDRWNLIRQNKDKLMEELEASDMLLELLEAEGVLSAENTRLVQFYQKNDERVEVLLEFVLKMKNGDYDKMCEVLDFTEQGDVVNKLLLTDDDFWVARRKLAEYYSKSCTDSRLVADPSSKSKVPQLHVPILWRRLIKDRTAVQDEILDAYYKIFAKLTVTGDSRIVIEGEQGAGKTTLIRRICLQWAQLVLSEAGEKKGPDSEEQRHLRRYNILLSFSLRHVRDEKSLKDIIKNQFKFLSVPEVYSISQYITKCQRQSMLMLDGLNEMGYSRVIHKIMRKGEHPDIRLITTSNSIGLNTIKPYGTKATEQHLKLLGFEKKEIKEYIDLYFGDRNDEGACATDLVDYMNKQKPGLWDLARFPLKTEMLCVVWESFWKSGNKQVELFQKFVELLLYKIDQLSGSVDVLSSEELMSKYSSLLTQVGSLANTWEEERLKLVFTEIEFENIDPKSLDLIKHVGLLRNEAQNEGSQFSFCHSAVQEYFVAYNVSNASTADLEVFYSRFSSIERLETMENIVRYICNISPNIANEMLERIINKTTDEKSCNDILTILLKLVQEFPSMNDVNVPLPCVVDARSCMVDAGILNSLLEKDSESFQNVRKVIIEDIDAIPNAIGQDYLEDLTLSLKGRSDTKIAIEKFDFMCSLEILKLDITDLGYASEPVKQVLESILPNRIRKLTVEGYNIVLLIAQTIDRLCVLEEVVIKENGKSFKADHIAQLGAAVNNCEELERVRVETHVFHEGFLLYDGKVGLEVAVSKIVTSKVQAFVDKLKTMTSDANISEIHLSCSDLCGSGPWLGQLLIRSKKLSFLSLESCSATWETIERIVATSKKAKETINISKLALSRNFLQGCGSYLGELIERTPQLQSLTLNDCQLNSTDLANMDSTFPDITALEDLDITDESLGGDTSALGKLWHHMPKLRKLRLSSKFIKGSNIKQCFEDVKSDSSLTDLRELEIANNQMGDEGVVNLSKVLPFLPNLEKLDLSHCGATDILSVFELVNNLPSNLTHFDISGNDFGHRVVLLKEAAWKFTGLKEFKISGQSGTEQALNLLVQTLQQVNPDMKISH